MDKLDQVQKDVMTGAYTREQLFPVLKKRIINANLHNEKLSILLVDIDHFKEINDKYGHLWGDEFLKYVASTLRLSLEGKGLIFRYGGDEFVVLFSTPDPKQAFLLAMQFNVLLKEHPFLFSGRLFNVTLSCGLATYPEDAQRAEDLVKAADKALYFSKRLGRNTTTRAGKIGVYRFRIISVWVLKASLIAALLFFLTVYVFRDGVQKSIKKLIVDNLFSFACKRDAKVVLENGTAVKGRIIAEDEDKLVIITPLKKDATRIILRGLQGAQ